MCLVIGFTGHALSCLHLIRLTVAACSLEVALTITEQDLYGYKDTQCWFNACASSLTTLRLLPWTGAPHLNDSRGPLQTSAPFFDFVGENVFIIRSMTRPFPQMLVKNLADLSVLQKMFKRLQLDESTRFVLDAS